MADNPLIGTGIGGQTERVAADDIGGVQYQRVKITFGANGTATDVTAAAALGKMVR